MVGFENVIIQFYGTNVMAVTHMRCDSLHTLIEVYPIKVDNFANILLGGDPDIKLFLYFYISWLGPKLFCVTWFN